MYNLSGKVAIITGSGRPKGIGAAIARRLAREGCRVVISDLGAPAGALFSESHIGQEKDMAAVVNHITQEGGQAMSVACDLRIEAQVEQLIQQTVEAYSRLDILVNNAGVGYLMAPLISLDAQHWDAVLDVNLKGAFLASKHAARQMIAQQSGGAIINIASQAAKSGFPYAAAYTASKHGLLGLTRSSALELGTYGIRVNAVCPNHITTDLGHWQNTFFSEKQGLDYDSYLQNIRDKNPLGRTGLTDDVAKAVAFLASEEAAYITGEALNVSGGEEYH